MSDKSVNTSLVAFALLTTLTAANAVQHNKTNNNSMLNITEKGLKKAAFLIVTACDAREKLAKHDCSHLGKDIRSNFVQQSCTYFFRNQNEYPAMKRCAQMQLKETHSKRHYGNGR